MSLLEVFLVGIGLSMDAFAVSVGKGLAMHRVDARIALALSFSFGLFQAFMPVAGWLLASTFAAAIEFAAHWVAFGLLVAIGAKMLFDAAAGTGGDAAEEDSAILGFAELMLLSIATSIDAFAVGITFAALAMPPMPAVAIIGVTTFAISLAGVCLGARFGAHSERHAGMLGGVILILIGVKVLVEHLIGA